MIIGLDFDNTIVNYTGVFYDVGRKLNYLPEGVGKSKSAVKQYLLSIDKEDTWTELQGKVYGRHIEQATPYAGVIDFIDSAILKGHQVYIISHKTKYPYIGEKVDFHEAALKWLNINGLINDSRLTLNQCFFNETKEDKLNKVKMLECDIFVDDLRSILDHELFPSLCKGILFSPDRRVESKHEQVSSWLALQEFF